MIQGHLLIRTERARQIKEENFDLDRDSTYTNGQLFHAAIAYRDTEPYDLITPIDWPFPSWWWKPKDTLQNLVRSGALFLAEKDRLISMRAPDGVIELINQDIEHVVDKINELLALQVS